MCSCLLRHFAQLNVSRHYIANMKPLFYLTNIIFTYRRNPALFVMSCRRSNNKRTRVPIRIYLSDKMLIYVMKQPISGAVRRKA